MQHHHRGIQHHCCQLIFSLAIIKSQPWRAWDMYNCPSNGPSHAANSSANTSNHLCQTPITQHISRPMPTRLCHGSSHRSSSHYEQYAPARFLTSTAVSPVRTRRGHISPLLPPRSFALCSTFPQRHQRVRISGPVERLRTTEQ
jgi:hypothetical protein